MFMMRIMRTTITLDDDVLEHARTLAAKLRTPFKTVINEALRSGLNHVEQPAEQKPYKTEPNAMGLKSGRHLDNIQELIAQIEGEDAR
jgi:predicted transcriptional regulator